MGGSSDQQQNSQQENGAVLALLAFMLWAAGGGGPALPQARRPRAASGSGYVGQPWPLPPPPPAPYPQPSLRPDTASIGAELGRHFAQGRLAPGAIARYVRRGGRDLPPEIQRLSDPQEWAAFQDMSTRLSRQLRPSSVSPGAGGSAGGEPVLSAEEWQGVRDAMRGATGVMRQFRDQYGAGIFDAGNGLAGGAAGGAGDAYVHIVNGRVARPGLASFADGGAGAGSLPRSAFHVDVDDCVEKAAAQLIVL